jgi:glyoxylase-like metal-dependent hydrolase (beta-lactamase superfamily II)
MLSRLVARSSSFAIVLAAASAAQLPAQSPRNFAVLRVADGVYTFVQRDALQSPIDGNTTVIINETDVVVVDTKATPATAREVIAEIRRLTSKPVTLVVNTHWHGDHHYGNDAFRQAWPTVEILAHENTRVDLLKEDTDSGRVASIARIPTSVADRRRFVSTGLMPDGSPLSGEMRAFYETQAKGLEYNREQLQELIITPPTTTITDARILRRGRRTIEIRFMGRANTRGDLVVFLPRERVVVTGDILVSPVPFAFGSYLSEWIQTLSAIRALDAVTVIPGHGLPQQGWSYLDRVSHLIQRTLSQVRATVAEGKDLAATRATVNLDSLRRVFAGESILLNRSFNNFFVGPAVERAFLAATGRLP